MTVDGRPADVLTDHQRRAIACLVIEPTRANAARRAGVSERTMRRWLSRVEFASEYRRQAREASEVAISATMAAQSAALAVLVEVMQAPEATAAARVRAARAVLEVGLRLRDHEVDDRLDDLEQEVRRWADQQQIVGGGWTG